MNTRKLHLGAALTFALLNVAPSTTSAQSSPKLYGVIDAWAGSSRLSGDISRTLAVNSGGMTTSYWGLAGTEELGGGTNLNYAIESYLQLDSGAAGRFATDALFARRAYVGLSSRMGEVRLGRLINPMYESVALVNPFGGSTRFSPLSTQTWVPAFGRTVYGDTSWDNAIAYSTPAVGGLKFTGQLGLGETKFGAGTRNSGLNAIYSSGPLYATLNAQQIKVGPGIDVVGQNTQRTYLLGGSYDFSLLKLFASYLHANSSRPDTLAKTMQIGTAFVAGEGSILMSWARTTKDVRLAIDTIRNTAALGYDYLLSKRTDAYLIYQYDKLSSALPGTTLALGLRHKF